MKPGAARSPVRWSPPRRFCRSASGLRKLKLNDSKQLSAELREKIYD